MRPATVAAFALALTACQPTGTDPDRPEPPEVGTTVEGLWFQDVTLAAGVDLDRQPADGYETLPDRFTGGICVLDVDGEGPLDLFFALRAGASRLYVASEPWSYLDETEGRGVPSDLDAAGCLAFDSDRDGDDDLLITGVGGLWLVERKADGTLEEATERLAFAPGPGEIQTSASAGDVDGDGRLDLLVGGFARWEPERFDPEELCGGVACRAQPHDFDWLPSHLLIQDEGGVFVDRSLELAPALGEALPTLVVSIQDLDEDGRPDLYLGQDLGEWNQALVQLEDGTFVDRAETLGLATDRLGNGLCSMGWSSGDLDHDGHLDHVVTAFTGDATGVWMCEAGGVCTERADEVGTTSLAQTFRWGAALRDLDLDGHVDLLEATGHVFDQDEAAAFLLGARDQPANLMVGDGAGHLSAILPSADDGLWPARSSRGLAVADLDDDGRLDALLAPAMGRPAVLMNVHPPEGGFVRLRFADPVASAGARIELRDEGALVALVERTVGEGFLGSMDPRRTLGIGDAESVEVLVVWPDGAHESHVGVAPGTEMVLGVDARGAEQ